MADGYISQIKTPDNKTYLLRDSEKTDEKVNQVSNSENKEFPIILKNTNNTTDETAGVKYAGGVTVNPDNETITAQEFKGNLNIANLIPISAKTYTTTLYNTSTGANYYQNFMTVEPTDYNAIWTIHYRLMVTAAGHSDYTAYYDCNLSGRANTYYSYKFYNSLVNYPIYYHMYLRSNSASTPHEIGVRIASSYGADTVQKTIRVELLEQINCTATLLDSLKLYTSALPSEYAGWVTFNATSNGLQETGDNDTTGRDYSHSGYGINGPDFRLPPYTIFGYDKNQKAQGISLYEPGYASSTTALSTTRVYNTAGFAWEKGLWFSNSGTNYAPNANLDFSPAEFYYATDMRYTDNVYLHKTTASELGIVARKPLYFRGTIGNDGLFYLAPITVTHNNTNYQRVWTQDIPDSDDGYVYWFIGYAYYSSSYAASGYQVNLVTENKLYWYHDGRFQEYLPSAVKADSIPLSGVANADDLKAIEAISGTTGLLKKTAANTWTLDTSNYVTSSGITSITIGATSPVQSSTSTAQSSSSASTTISLADAYGDTKNPYGSKTKNYVLAAPSNANGVPSFRALVATDIPNKIQTNWELNAASGNSPALLFTRDGSLTDWKIFVTSGKLSFQSATDGSTWTERAYFKDNSGDFVATSFTGKGSDLTDLNASNISSGTLSLARLGNQNANVVLAGPASGNAAAPTFRALVAADIPNLSWNKITSDKPAYTTRWPTWQEITGKPDTFIPEVHEHNYLVPISGSVSSGQSSPNNTLALGIKKYFDDNKANIPRGKLISFGVSAYSNALYAIGHFLSGYDDAPYGGFYAVHYLTPRFLGISNGTYQESYIARVNVTNTITSGQVMISDGTDGKIKSSGYTIAKSVPSNAVFTDHYAWSDITSKPTTISGYGITDAKITSGTITLGSNTISPITEINWDSTNKKLTRTINGAAADVVTAATLRTDLGLSNALHFIGVTSTTLADGSTTNTLAEKSTGSLTKTTDFVDGDVVMDGDQLREYVWSGSAWRLLGITTSTAYTQPTSTATNTWIAQVSQGTDGKITATTGSLNTSGTWSGNATTATTATNLANNPSIQTSGTTQVTITAGGKTSSAYTVPYATSAGSATSATSATTATYIKCTDTRSTALNPTDLNAAQGIRFDFKAKGTINLTATDAYAGVMSFRPYASNSDWSGGNAHQLAFNSEGLHWRNGGASWGNWYQILDSNNTTTGTNNTATLAWNTTYTIAKINGTDIKFTTMTKPTYAFSDLTSHPTTLSDYGITDAASSNHSHTLKIGNESLSVSTSEQTWSVHNILFNSTSIGTATSWDQTTPGAYYVASNATFTGTGHPGTNQEAPYSYGGLYVLRAGNGGAAQIYISHNASNTTNKAYGIRYRSGWNVINNTEETHWVSWATILDDKNYSLFAWKRPSSITTGQVLISNGTDGTTTTRAILNNTSKSALGWNSAGNTNADNLRFMTVNTLAYWNGAYSGTTSNLSVLGTVTTGTWNASVIEAAYGGTGQNTLQKSANVLINALDTGSSDLTANDYVITQYVGGGTTTTSYHRRPASKVINATLVKGALGTDSSTTNQWLNKKGEWSTPTAAEVGAITKLNSSTDNAIVRFDGTSGQIQNSGVIVDDNNNMSASSILLNSYSGYDLCKLQTSASGTEIIIKTKFKFINSSTMPSIHIHGYSYGKGVPLDLTIVYYIYSGEFYAQKVISNGGVSPEIYLFTYTENSNKYVAIGMKSSLGYVGFSVDAHGGALGSLSINSDNTLCTTGWTIEHNGSNTSNTLIPEINTNNCESVPYVALSTTVQNTISANLTTTKFGIAYYSDTAGTFAGTGAGTSGQYLKSNGSSAPTWATFGPSTVGLGNVENTKLSTWTGSSNITTVGTISNGTWQGTPIASAYIGSHTHSYAGSSSAGGAATSANALNFVHTNELLLGNANSQSGIHINHRRVSGGATSGNTAITDYYFKNGNGAVTGVTIHAAAFDGSATSAGKWTTARTLTIGSTGKSVDGSENVSWSLAEIGAAAEEHGTHVTTATVQSALGISSSGSASKALTQKGTFVEFGTSNLTIGNTSSTAMAGNTNVNNVTQTVTTSSYSNWRPLLVGDSNGTADTFTVTTKTGATYGVHSIKVQPSSGTIKATTFQGNLTGNVTGDASTVGGHTVGADVPSDAVFTDTNKYHTTGSWGGTNNLTYTATAVNSAESLAFTLATASTSSYGATKLYDGVDSTSTTLAATANAVKTAYDTATGIVAAADAMVFKGTRDGAAISSNGGAGGLTPAANRGDTYKVATAGYINGEPVEIGDIIICTTDSTAASTSSNYSTIKANWVIVQNNVDGAIFKGTNSFTDTHVIIADGSNGKVKDSGFTIGKSVPSDAKFTDTTSFTITASATDGLWDLTGTNGTNKVTYALAPYTSKGTTATFYTAATNPTLTTRLNYDGYLYATKLYSGGTEVSVSGHTHSYLPLSGGRLTGTLSLRPTGNGEGGQINMGAAEENTTQSGVAIDQCANELRIFGIASADGTTRTGTGTTLHIDPYLHTLYGAYDVTFKTITINNSADQTGVPHLIFSRSGWNYITIPENDSSVLSVGFGEPGNNTNQRLVIYKTGTVRPGTNGSQNLGDNEHKWNSVYGVNFYGTFNGTSTYSQGLAKWAIDNSNLNNLVSNGALRYSWEGGSNSIASKPADTDAFGVIAFKTATNWTGQIFMSCNLNPGIYWRNNLTSSSPSYGNWTPLANGNGSVYYGTCSTAANVAEKAVICKHYHTLKAGDIIVVTFTNANTEAQPKLNVNNTGAAYVKMAYSGGIVDLGSTTQLSYTCTFIYDGTYWLIINQQNTIQLATASNQTNWRSILLSNSNSGDENFTPSANTLGRTYAAHNVKYQPSTGTLRAPIMKTPKVQIEYNHVNKAHIEWNDTDSSIDFIFD